MTVMRTNSTPTIGLLAGLAVTLSAVAVYASFTVVQLRGLRQLQAETIDRKPSNPRRARHRRRPQSI